MQLSTSHQEYKPYAYPISRSSSPKKVKNGKAKSKGKRRASGRNPGAIAGMRLSAIRKLIEDRHAWVLSDEEALTYFQAALPNLAVLARNKGHKSAGVLAWVKKHLPSMVIDHPVEFFHEADRQAMADEAWLPDSDAFAASLYITDDVVQSLKLRTVGSIDRLKPQREAERKAKDCARKEKQRRDEERDTRPEYRRKSIKATVPRLPGESTSTFYRRVQKMREEGLLDA
jgi:hypothetical protein